MRTKTQKLLIVATIGRTIEGFLLPFAAHYRALGWRVDAFAHGVTRSPVCVNMFDAVWEADWSRSPLDLRANIAGAKQLRRLVEEQKYDIVHLHTPVAAFVGRAALRKEIPGLKVVYTAHGFHFYKGGPLLRNLVFRSCERFAARWTNALIVINEEDRQAAIKDRLVPEERLQLMPGIGLDTSAYSVDAVPQQQIDLARDSFGIRPSQFVFLLVAEMNPGKRHRDALLAFARLPKRCVMIFAGSGPLLPRLQQMALELGVKDRIFFAGVRRDMTTLYCLADSVLLPSEREGLPRSIMEAMAMRRPVIGGDTRGIRDLLSDGCGFLAPVGDVDQLANRMRFVVDHREAARAVAEKGHQRVLENDIRHVLHLHDQLYSAVLQTEPAKRQDRSLIENAARERSMAATADTTPNAYPGG